MVKLSFDAVPERENTVRHIGSLVFDMRKELGQLAYFDLRKTEDFVELARSFIACLFEHARPVRISTDLSLGSYFTAIDEFLDFCRGINLASDFKMRDISTELLITYRTYIKIKFSDKKSNTPRTRFGNIVRLLSAGDLIGLTSNELELPRNFRHIGDSDVTQPYTAGELLDIEDACRTHIRELTERLEKGQKLLAEGVDPQAKRPKVARIGPVVPMKDEDRPWNKLPNLVWYVVNRMDSRYLKRSELIEERHSSFNNSITGTWNGPYRKTDVYSHLYPLAIDMVPFAILLAKKTGRNESSILGLTRDCLTQVAGRYVLWYKKDRGADRLYKKPILNDGQFSPVQLINLLLVITEPLVRLTTPEHKNRLFLGLTISSGGPKKENTGPVKPPEMSYYKYQMNNADGWCVQRDLVTENGETLSISMRRLRTSYLTLRYRRTGQLSGVSRDAAHKVIGTSVDYVHNNATKHIHEEAIEAGILSAREVSRITVITEDSVSVAAKILNTDSDKARSVLSGEQDVLFNSCRDFYNRPGGPANTPCGEPWNCFSCPNMIVTRHVLPRVMRLKQFIEEQRTQLMETEWNEKFSGVYHVIMIDILPNFSSRTITEAVTLALHETFYVPLSFKW